MDNNTGSEKQQTLNDLYALRAGLSVISEENDKANEAKDLCEKSIKDILYHDSIFEYNSEQSLMSCTNK